jgi:hypothetical protein
LCRDKLEGDSADVKRMNKVGNGLELLVMDWVFIPQFISDYKIKTPKLSVVESRELKSVSWAPMRPTMFLGGRHPGFLHRDEVSKITIGVNEYL